MMVELSFITENEHEGQAVTWDKDIFFIKDIEDIR